MTSMTGYAYEEKNYENAIVSVEIKSVNSRFLDLTINLPSYLNGLESFFRHLITKKVVRGKVDVFIRIKETETDTQIIVDTKLAKAYVEAYKKIIKETKLGFSGQVVQRTVFMQPGVLISNKTYDNEKYKDLILPVFENALEKFSNDRMREGENLFIDLQEKLLKLEKCAVFFKEYQPKMEASFKETILTKFTELLGANVDENRIMTETASMIVKYTINEEVVRLQSHIEAMKEELNNPAPGKKIDFICQEMNREINTIGSKNQFVEVGAMVIEAKDSLENIREQAKNVE